VDDEEDNPNEQYERDAKQQDPRLDPQSLCRIPVVTQRGGMLQPLRARICCGQSVNYVSATSSCMSGIIFRISTACRQCFMLFQQEEEFVQCMIDIQLKKKFSRPRLAGRVCKAPEPLNTGRFPR